MAKEGPRNITKDAINVGFFWFRQTLGHFGLKKITDLPGLSELKSMGLLDPPPLYDKEGSKTLGQNNLPLPKVGEEEDILPLIGDPLHGEDTRE